MTPRQEELPHQDSNLDTPVNSRTLCRLSYRGSASGSLPDWLDVLLTRVSRKTIVTESGCWQWTGSLNNRGYSQVSVGGKPKSGHRVFYEAFVGRIPDGLQIDHLCRNKACINPAHLEAVTAKQNQNRTGHGSETHCKRGHLLSDDNLYIGPRGGRTPSRQCRMCRAERQRARRAAERVKAEDAA